MTKRRRLSVFDQLDPYLRVEIEGRWNSKEMWINGRKVGSTSKDTVAYTTKYCWGPRDSYPDNLNQLARYNLKYNLLQTVSSLLFEGRGIIPNSRGANRELDHVLDSLPQSDFKKVVRLPILKKSGETT